MKTPLELAIENLYTVFEKYHLYPQTFKENSCPCCYDRKSGVMATKPLIVLTADDLTTYLISSIYTIGTIEDYKHFLPRILELMSQDDGNFISDFVLSDKLTYAEWETWPDDEITAIDQFFVALCTHAFFDKNINELLIEQIINLGTHYGYLDLVLETCLLSTSKESALYIVDGVINGFCFKVNDQEYKIITSWLFSDPVLQKLEDLFFSISNKESANLISIAYTILDNKQHITFH